MKILIKNITIVDMEGNEPYISDLLVDNDTISKIDDNIQDGVDKIIDGTNKLIMPGLINTHSHLGMSLFRTYGENKKLMDWLNNYIFPKEELLTPELVYDFTMLSCIEAIKSGTTCLDDMYFYEQEVVKVFERLGLRGIIGVNLPIDEDNNIITKVKEKGLEDLIYLYGGPHAPYTTTEESYIKYVDIAKKYNIGIQTHLSETQDEVNIIKERYNKTSTKHLYDLGVLDVPVILPHGIYLSDEDIEILKNVNGGIVHNPISNAKLASGICDVRKLLDSGITVGLGTDGASSTTTLDMFEEMKTCAYMQKLKYMDSSIISSYEILQMATINNAKIINKQNEIGSIKIGKKADLIILDLNKPHLIPINDIYSTLVYGANGSDVVTTIINGKILMENRKLIDIDENEVINNCNEIAKDFYK